MLNPGQLFGHSSSHTLADLFSLLIQTPLVSLILLVQFAVAGGLVRAAARPLTVRAYLKAVRQAQEQYYARYTSLPTGSYPYDVPILYYQDTPDPTQPTQTEALTLLDLVARVMASPSAHLLLLGSPGAGKTTILHA